ncbi:MAG: hypothetical protein HQL52_11235 [Magnetococcales bacterium]|nr:hypothetical protein [Magnetococcales bacterium]
MKYAVEFFDGTQTGWLWMDQEDVPELLRQSHQAGLMLFKAKVLRVVPEREWRRMEAHMPAAQPMMV